MAEQLLKCSANFTPGLYELLNEGRFVDCTLAAEGRTLKAHRAVLSAASSYFKLLFAEEQDRDPVVIFTSIKFKDLEAVLRLIYQGEVMVSEDRLAGFLNVLIFLQIDGVDCNKLVVRMTSVPTYEDAISLITSEATITQGSSSVSKKVECEFSAEESADNNHTLQQYLHLDESSSTTLASAYGTHFSSMPPCEVKSDLGDFENNLACSTSEPAFGDELSTLVTDIEIKDEEINSNLNEEDDMTLRIEDEPTSENWNDDNDREVDPGQDDATFQFEDVVKKKIAVPNIGNGEELFKCPSCDFETSQRTDLTVHKCPMIVKSPFERSHCSLSTVQSSDANKHEFKHLKGKSFKCSQCSYTCRSKPYMKKHMFRHTGEKPLKCSECPYACIHKSNLIYHIRNHRGEKPFKCSHCSYACNRKGNLIKHLRTHRGKLFKCSRCSYASKQKSHFITHVRTHTEGNIFRCSQCDYACSRKGNLTRHWRSHTGEKPFKCSNCTYACSKKQYLISHMLKHTGEKPF